MHVLGAWAFGPQKSQTPAFLMPWAAQSRCCPKRQAVGAAPAATRTGDASRICEEGDPVAPCGGPAGSTHDTIFREARGYGSSGGKGLKLRARQPQDGLAAHHGRQRRETLSPHAALLPGFALSAKKITLGVSWHGKDGKTSRQRPVRARESLAAFLVSMEARILAT